MSEAKQITIEDLNAHKERDDLWLLINGKVYDVTKFLDEHPGGDEVLIEEGGRDATEAFEDVGHSDEARDMLVKMYIGQGPADIKVGRQTTTAGAGATSEGSNVKLLLPLAILGAWIAWRFFLA